MHSHSTTLRDATDEELIANLKKFLAEEASSSAHGEGGYGGGAGGSRSSFGGGKTTFSPKKPKSADSRPAVLARGSWIINVDPVRKMVTVGGEFHLLFFTYAFSK